jgi:MFS family permease
VTVRDGPPAAEPAPPERSSWRLLADPTFGPFTAGLLGSAMGMWIQNIVAAVVVFELTGSAFMVGAVSMAQFVPQVALAPLAGALADRGNRRLLAAAGYFAGGLPIAALATWVGVAGLDGLPGAWPIIAAMGVSGIGFAVSMPAGQALVPALVRPAELSGAVALNVLPFTIARAAGPGLGALLLALAGPGAGFGAAAAGHGVFVAVLLWLRPRAQPRATGGDRSIRAGLRHLRTDPVVALLLLTIMVVGLGLDPVLTLTPPLAAQLGGGEELVGAMASAFGVGAAVTVVLLARIRRRLGLRRSGPVGLAGMAAGMAGLAVAPRPAWALAALAVGGMGMIVAMTALTTQLQQRLPEELRGRVMALWSVCYVGSRPVAAAVNGALADLTSVQVPLVLTTVMLLVTAGLLARRTRPLAAGFS